MRKKLKRKFANQYRKIFVDRLLPSEPRRVSVFRMSENDYISYIKPRRQNDLIRKSKLDCYSVKKSIDRAVLQRSAAFWVPVMIYSLNRKSTIQGNVIGRRSLTVHGYTYTSSVRMTRKDMFKTSNQFLFEVK